MLAASWALPAVGVTLRLARPWIVLLSVINMPTAMIWSFYCRKLGWYLFVRGRESGQRVITAEFLAEFLSILVLTITVQFVIYRLVFATTRLFG
jgi:hypothetical protein